MIVIEPKHVGIVLMQILIFFSSNSFVHQLVNKTLKSTFRYSKIYSFVTADGLMMTGMDAMYCHSQCDNVIS